MHLREFVLQLLPASVKAYMRHQKRQGFPVLQHKMQIAKDFLSFVHTNRIIKDPSDTFEGVAKTQAKVIENIIFDSNGYYIYPYDTHLIRIPKNKEIASLTPDYAFVLLLSLSDVKAKLTNSTPFDRGLYGLICAIEHLGERIKNALQEKNDLRSKEIAQMFPDCLYRIPVSFDEALQKILFYNALLWQNRIWHNGLGRLDKILYPYYLQDITNGILTTEIAKNKLKQFILLLNRDTLYKSHSLIGDTGQVIILGGIDNSDTNIANTLTEMFLEIIKELHIPDPKLILRVNADTPDNIWKLAVDTLTTGCGSPLLMNESLIIPLMEQFGYEKSDCSELGTSACWEPLIIGKSFDQNNPMKSIAPVSLIMNLTKKNYSIFEDFLNDYCKHLSNLIKQQTRNLKFDKSPILSLLYESCLVKRRDISEGGAKYAYHGIQIVGLPNTINALINIKKFVFEKEILSLKQCHKLLKSNYKKAEDIRVLLLNSPLKFGSSEDEIVTLTNQLISCISKATAMIKINGSYVKVGFSSPAYIDSAQQIGASLDGRKSGEPLAVHISPISSSIDLAEILDFASKLDYNVNCINGNVVDFILPLAYAKQPDKLVSVLKNACEKGVFELQLNVLDRHTLIDAKVHPEKYPNLIVRVWGFSAYFNDLPEAFKDNLIHRAEIYAAS